MGCGMRMSFVTGLGCLCYGWALQPSMLVWGMSRTMGPLGWATWKGWTGEGSILVHTLQAWLAARGTVEGADCGVSALVCPGPSTMPLRAHPDRHPRHAIDGKTVLLRMSEPRDITIRLACPNYGCWGKPKGGTLRLRALAKW